MTVDAALTRLTQAMAPWDAGRAFRNFSERPGRFFDGHAAHRLRALKAQVDGDDLLSPKGRIGSDPSRFESRRSRRAGGGRRPRQYLQRWAASGHRR